MENLIEEAFQNYKAEVIPAGAGRIQVSETRSAFYAGVTTILNKMVEVNSEQEMGELFLESIDAVGEFVRELNTVNENATK